jgi:type VI secretion system secreted protein VgrG
MTRHDFESKCFHGEGSVRDLCAGEYFTLSGHPEVDRHPREERDFVVTALQVNAQNNLPKALAERVERLFSRSRWTQGAQEPQTQKEVADRMASGALRMHIQFTAVRRGVKIVPAYDARTDLPQALMQSAIVVGPKGEEVYCDQMGRVKIRFPATRAADHKHADGSGVSNDDSDSAWVRVASNWAGNGPGSVDQCGTVGLPRVGTEVLVNFLGGDPDKPVIVGQLYNQQAQPPALSDQGDLPGNRYLSGIKSREIKGGRGNQLRLDDTSGEISAQLASDHGRTELNLGFLTSPRQHGGGESRGEGAELRSDMATAVRGVGGVLITAESGGGAEGKQLERTELIRVAGGLQKLGEQLSKLAEKFAQEGPHSDDLRQLIQTVQQLESTNAAIVALHGPSGVAIASGQNVQIGAATSIDICSSEDTYVSSGGRAVVLSARGTSLFANEGDMKLTAVSGKVLIQAQNEALQVLAKKVLEVISTTDWINISAKKGVRINGGGTELVLSSDGIMGYTGGKHEMHAADHQTMGASSRQAEFPGSKTCPTRAKGAAQSGESDVPLN